MIEIVPAILTSSAQEFRELMKRMVEAGVRRIHLDIGDGSFVPTETITGYEELLDADLGVDWDVHLMVHRPEEHLRHWWNIQRADRFLVHVETTDDFGAVAGDVHAHERKIGAVLNPDTGLDVLAGVVPHVDLVQFMTVFPGRQGAEFQPWVLEHVKKIHEAHPQLLVSVDGGVTPDTAPACAAAGARSLVSGSFVVGSADVASAIEELKQSVISF